MKDTPSVIHLHVIPNLTYILSHLCL